MRCMILLMAAPPAFIVALLHAIRGHLAMGRMQRDAVFGSIPAAGGIHCSKKGECAMTDRPRPARRRRTPPPPRGKREQPASRRGDRRLAQLAVSAVLLLAVVVVKITAPSAMDRYRDRLLNLPKQKQL